MIEQLLAERVAELKQIDERLARIAKQDFRGEDVSAALAALRNDITEMVRRAEEAYTAF